MDEIYTSCSSQLSKQLLKETLLIVKGVIGRHASVDHYGWAFRGQTLQCRLIVLYLPDTLEGRVIARWKALSELSMNKFMDFRFSNF